MLEIDLQIALKTATEAALRGGQILKDCYGQVREICYKGAIDIVTEVDKASEAAIIKHLKQNHPDWNILAEESGHIGNQAYPVKWLVDPLDGTTNYAHAYPFFCVSIALEVEGDVVLGVVFDPLRDELFTVIKGQPAYLNGKQLKVSATGELCRSLLVTGIPYNIKTDPGRIFETFKKFVLSAQAVRRDGSAALDLAYVAAGRFDGFWEERLAPWDVAAGSLLVLEAGGKVSTFKEEFNIYAGKLLASNGLLHKDMQEVLAPENFNILTESACAGKKQNYKTNKGSEN
ncbi:MAG: inositol monophosphatase [Candidatus Schekmanbacteria bacterium]|nr:inositol monophosphatase [Candidatus Schekmanbacteria bacterium]